MSASTTPTAPDITRFLGRKARVRHYGPDRIATLRVYDLLGVGVDADGRPYVGGWTVGDGDGEPRLVKIMIDDVIEYAVIERAGE